MKTSSRFLVDGKSSSIINVVLDFSRFLVRLFSSSLVFSLVHCCYRLYALCALDVARHLCLYDAFHDLTCLPAFACYASGNAGQCL